MPSSANRMSGDDPCSPTAGREFRSTRTYETFPGRPLRKLTPDQVVEAVGLYQEGWSCQALGSRYGVSRQSMWDLLRRRTTMRPKGVMPSEATRGSTFSAEASRDRAKTSPSPDNDEASLANDPSCFTSSPASSTLFDPDGFSSRTFRVSSLQTAVGTSEQCLERWPTSGTAWGGGFSTAVSSECRSDDDGCSSSEPSLMEILEPPLTVPAKYSLSARAAQGILRRAQKRGRTLPPHLQQALAAVAEAT